MEELGLWVGFVLTIFVYSYIIRDNFLYRLAVYTFVGLAAGYIAIVTVESVLLPWFELTIDTKNPANLGLGLVPVLLGVLLLFKTSPRLAQLGNLGMAVIVGVGTGVALVGTLTGTLIPLVDATARVGRDNILNGVLLFVGVGSSLLYFQYAARRTPEGAIERPRRMQAISVLGEGFIAVTLGALYAAAILTSLTIFSERLSFILGRF